MRTIIFCIFLLHLLHCSITEAEVDCTRAIIHHTATDRSVTVECIRRYHVEERGWDDIGYHFLIDWRGQVYEGRPLAMDGAHALGRNQYVGIALIGNSRTTDFTMAQVVALLELLEVLEVETIEAHHKDCPGIPLEDLICALIKEWNTPIPQIINFRR